MAKLSHNIISIKKLVQQKTFLGTTLQGTNLRMVSDRRAAITANNAEKRFCLQSAATKAANKIEQRFIQMNIHPFQNLVELFCLFLKTYIELSIHFEFIHQKSPSHGAGKTLPAREPHPHPHTAPRTRTGKPHQPKCLPIIFAHILTS